MCKISMRAFLPSKNEAGGNLSLLSDFKANFAESFSSAAAGNSKNCAMQMASSLEQRPRMGSEERCPAHIADLEPCGGRHLMKLVLRPLPSPERVPRLVRRHLRITASKTCHFVQQMLRGLVNVDAAYFGLHV